MVHKQTKTEAPTHEDIEFARVSGWKPVPHTPGAPWPPYPERDLGFWQKRRVPLRIGNLCRELSRRGPHGLHLSKVDHDDIAEMDLLGLSYNLVDWDRHNTWGRKLFIVTDVIYRFQEDHEAANH